MNSGLAMVGLVGKTHIHNNLELGGVVTHVTVLACHNAAKSDGAVIAIRHSPNILNNIRMSLEDRQPEIGVSGGDASTSVDKCTDRGALFGGSIDRAESQRGEWKLVVNLGRKRRLF
jgi:hypothetical protein